MRCRTFKIHLSEEARNSEEEARLNKFLESVAVRQTFASVVADEYWSILIFYEDASVAASQPAIHDNFSVQTPDAATAAATAPPIKQPAAKSPSPEGEKPAPEPVVLTPEQENTFNRLKQWRNDRANQDGLPPYMIAQNESLMQIAASRIETVEDFLRVKGFGEKRAQKYGEEILNILRADSTI
ncbi:MAG: HRDC domain-containing protein [Acidobacteriota bacterium]|nr:HRDC domain-containing protein [Acidobacteriota bacterium]